MRLDRALAVFLVLAAAALWSGLARACEDMGRPCCDYCRMIITEKSFGGDARTSDRRLLIFDSTECMAAFWLTLHRDTIRVRSMRSILVQRPAQLVDARRAYYVRSDSLPSPMSVNLSAYATARSARAVAMKYRGSVLTWHEVVELVRRRWFYNGVPFPK